jgi:DNA-binding SARP family transcriptional activator/TolB-like protein
LLGHFGVDINAGIPVPVTVRFRKSRALLAFLAMSPDFLAQREALATLFWGDSPDIQARHSLRQCLTSLRQDLRLAPDLLFVERHTVGLKPSSVSVDARDFISLASSSDFEAASQLYRGPFLADLALDSEEFDLWRRREADRLKAAAADLFMNLARGYDKSGNGKKALEFSDRLVALDPLREDWQRTLLLVWARHKGRDAAVERADRFIKLLRQELDVTPSRETRALIEDIKSGEIEPVPAVAVELPPSLAVNDDEEEINAEPAEIDAEPDPGKSEASEILRPSMKSNVGWLAGGVLFTVATILFVGFLETRSHFHPSGLQTAEKIRQDQIEGADAFADARSAAKESSIPVVVLPFTVDSNEGTDERQLASALAQTLVGYLAHYPQLRMISARGPVSGENSVEIAKIGADLGVSYAVTGRIHGNAKSLGATFQLVDTRSRLNLWSDELDRPLERVAKAADEMSRGIARALAIQINAAEALRQPDGANKASDIGDLVIRARAAEQRGPWSENLSESGRLYEQALQLDPHYIPALLGVARVAVMAQGNWVDLDKPISLDRAEQMLREVLVHAPNSASAQYVLGQLQKLRGYYAESIKSFERALELNPSFIFSNVHIGHSMARLGQPREGLERIHEYLRLAPANEPARGFGYIFEAEAELAMGDKQGALDAILSANAFFPGCPRVQGWLAAMYEMVGDPTNAVRYAAAFRWSSPLAAERFLDARRSKAVGAEVSPPEVVLDSLRVALDASRG